MLWGLYQVVEPTERGFIERLGEPRKYVTPGGYWVLPIIERLRFTDVREEMFNIDEQVIISKDRVNFKVDAQIRIKIRDDEESVRKSLYKAANFKQMMVFEARNTLRKIIGGLSFEDANSKRDEINNELMEILKPTADAWGAHLVYAAVSRVELPFDVQERMNNIINQESDKKAAMQKAEAVAIEAEGKKKASIFEAEGNKQKTILNAEAEKEKTLREAEAKSERSRIEALGNALSITATAKAEGESVTIAAKAESEKIKAIAAAQAEAITKVNEATEESFTPKVQALKKLEVTQAALQNNTKFFVPQGTDLTMLVGDAGVLPIKSK